MQQLKRLRFLLDAGVPDSVKVTLEQNDHEVILHRDVLADGSPDQLVCLTAVSNNAILVAIDGDMKIYPKHYGSKGGDDRTNRLHLVRLRLSEVMAASRISQALSLIQHEWTLAETANRRLWIDISKHTLTSNR